MSSSEKQRQVYIKETQQWIPVSEEFYKNYYRDIEAYRRRQQRHDRCACPRKKWWLCDKLCEDCKFCTVKEPLSLEMEMETETETDEGTTTLAEILPDPAANIEEIITQKDTVDALYRELEHLASDDRRICELFLEGKTKCEIARIMNLPLTTYRRHRRKATKILRDRLKDYV